MELHLFLRLRRTKEVNLTMRHSEYVRARGLKTARELQKQKWSVTTYQDFRCWYRRLRVPGRSWWSPSVAPSRGSTVDAVVSSELVFHGQRRRPTRPEEVAKLSGKRPLYQRIRAQVVLAGANNADFRSNRAPMVYQCSMVALYGPWGYFSMQTYTT